jgi:hypothetical protein
VKPQEKAQKEKAQKEKAKVMIGGVPWLLCKSIEIS